MATDLDDNLDFAQLFSTDLNDNVDAAHGVYSPDEHVIIDKYKERYMSAKTPFERKNLAQFEMFPELFKYWMRQGIIKDKRDTQAKSIVRSSSMSHLPTFFFHFYLFRGFYSGYAILGAPIVKSQKQN